MLKITRQDGTVFFFQTDIRGERAVIARLRECGYGEYDTTNLLRIEVV